TPDGGSRESVLLDFDAEFAECALEGPLRDPLCFCFVLEGLRVVPLAVAEIVGEERGRRCELAWRAWRENVCSVHVRGDLFEDHPGRDDWLAGLGVDAVEGDFLDPPALDGP